MDTIKQLLRSLLGKKYGWIAQEYNQLKTYLYSFLHPYYYTPKRYTDTFLIYNSKITDEAIIHKKAPSIIYIFWTGDNEITPNRMAGIKSLEKNAHVEVKLITNKNLKDYIIEGDPLPEAYQYLSFVHKSDYLRSYFMHHYGGGYADIKTYSHSWKQAFDKLNESDAYAIGYGEIGFWGVANQDIEQQNLKHDLRNYWRLLIGNGAFICRPHTKFTEEWHREVNRVLVSHSEALRKHPAKDAFGTNTDYPLRWTEIQGEVFHPLCLKYHKKILADNCLKPSFKNYR